jgi:hypothetical protein
LFGADILVAPVVDAGVTQREVYLPAGVWCDFWTEACYIGPRQLTVPAPLDTLPLFVRQAAIIPLGPEMQFSGERLLDPLTVETYRGGDRAFTLYEDDGETTQYQAGAYRLTPISVTERAGEFSCRIAEARGDFAGQPSERGYILRVHLQPAVGAVSCNGTALTPLGASQSFAGAEGGWWWDRTVQLLTIKLPHLKALAVAIQDAPEWR